jgi:hypothetical protein
MMEEDREGTRDAMEDKKEEQEVTWQMMCLRQPPSLKRPERKMWS